MICRRIRIDNLATTPPACLLLLLWAALLFGGFAWAQIGEPPRGLVKWTRLASSAVLLAAACGWCAHAPAGATRRLARLLAAGMTCGLLGDLILAGVLPGGRSLPAGMLAFGIGHICYIGAFLGLARHLELTRQIPMRVAVAVWLLVGFTGWYALVWHGQEAGPAHALALPYALLLAGTAGVATGMAWQNRMMIPLALGSALFLLSDLLIAAREFGALRLPMHGHMVWLTYGPAQMLIVYTAGAAIMASGRRAGAMRARVADHPG